MQHDDVLALAWAAVICLAIGGTGAALMFPLVYLGAGAIQCAVAEGFGAIVRRWRRR